MAADTETLFVANRELVEIRLGVYTSNNDGGERPMGMWRSTGPIVIGGTVASAYSFAKKCEPFSVSTDGSLIDNVTAAWGIELLPIRVVGYACAFGSASRRRACEEQLSR